MSASALNTIVLFEAISGGEVAQSVEQRTENPRVHSSILCLATIFLPSDNPDQYPKYPSYQL